MYSSPESETASTSPRTLAPTTSDRMMYNDLPNTPPKHSYTNLVVEESSLWLCPECNLPSLSQRKWALKIRGYKKIPKNYKHPIPKSYGKDYKEKLYFANPAGVVRCQNGWDMGTSGTRCTFNREEVEGFRDKEREEIYDERRGQYFYLCPRCSVSPDDLILNQDRYAYVKGLEGLKGMMKKEPPYNLYERSPWDGYPVYVRQFLYEGTEESLKCWTKNWGLGNREEGRNVPCNGRYGGPVTFWVLELAEEIKMKRSMSETGEYIDKSKMDKDNYDLDYFKKDWRPQEPWKKGANDSEGSEGEDEKKKNSGDGNGDDDEEDFDDDDDAIDFLLGSDSTDDSAVLEEP